MSSDRKLLRSKVPSAREARPLERVPSSPLACSGALVIAAVSATPIGGRAGQASGADHEAAGAKRLFSLGNGRGKITYVDRGRDDSRAQ